MVYILLKILFLTAMKDSERITSFFHNIKARKEISGSSTSLVRHHDFQKNFLKNSKGTYKLQKVIKRYCTKDPKGIIHDVLPKSAES